MRQFVSFTGIARLTQALYVGRKARPSLSHRNDVIHGEFFPLPAMSALPFLLSANSQPFFLRCFAAIRSLVCEVKACLQQPMRSHSFQVSEIPSAPIAFPKCAVLGILLSLLRLTSLLLCTDFFRIFRTPTAHLRNYPGSIFYVVSSLIVRNSLFVFTVVKPLLPIKFSAILKAIPSIRPLLVSRSLRDCEAFYDHG